MKKLVMYKMLFVFMLLLPVFLQAQVLPRRNSAIKPVNNGTTNNTATTKIIPQPKSYVPLNEISGTGRTSTMAIRKVNSDYQLTDNDYAVIALPAYQGGPLNITITLPAAVASEGRIYLVKNAGDGFVHVSAQELNEWGENTVRQTGTPAIRVADVNRNTSISFQSDGKLWWRF